MRSGQRLAAQGFAAIVARAVVDGENPLVGRERFLARAVGIDHRAVEMHFFRPAHTAREGLVIRGQRLVVATLGPEQVTEVVPAIGQARLQREQAPAGLDSFRVATLPMRCRRLALLAIGLLVHEKHCSRCPKPVPYGFRHRKKVHRALPGKGALIFKKEYSDSR